MNLVANVCDGIYHKDTKAQNNLVVVQCASLSLWERVGVRA